MNSSVFAINYRSQDPLEIISQSFFLAYELNLFTFFPLAVWLNFLVKKILGCFLSKNLSRPILGHLIVPCMISAVGLWVISCKSVSFVSL